jgi:hypothetical protein
VSFAYTDIERIARAAAKLHKLDFTVKGGEVRFKHRTADWYGVLLADKQPSLAALQDEMDELAERTAGGPST